MTRAVSETMSTVDVFLQALFFTPVLTGVKSYSGLLR